MSRANIYTPVRQNCSLPQKFENCDVLFIFKHSLLRTVRMYIAMKSMKSIGPKALTIGEFKIMKNCYERFGL